MENSQTPKPPENSPEEVPQEIPSVVAAAKKTSAFAFTAFFAFLAILVMLVLHKKPDSAHPPLGEAQPSSALAPAQTQAATPVLPPQLAQTPAAPEQALTPDDERRQAARALREMRLKSPIILVNKFQTPSASGSGVERAAATDGGGTHSPGPLPLPQGFTPSVGAASVAQQMNDRAMTIAQGKILPAILETAINTDHPGMLRALVSEDVYADAGERVMLPRGTRLVGQYDAAVDKGQSRVFVYWNRAIRPDGISIELGSAGTDTLGRTGLEGNVHMHFLEMFGAATLLSVIGASASTVGVNAADNANSLASYREGATNGFNSAANTVLGQFVQIKPTITVPQGAALTVFVARDLSFAAAGPGEDQAVMVP